MAGARSGFISRRGRIVAPVLMMFGAIAAAPQRPPNFTELAARAATAREANDTAGAIALYAQALQLNPTWAEGWWMSGSLQYDSARYAGGADSLSRLVKLSPQAGPAWALLGLCEYETGVYPDAFEHIQRSLALGVGNQPQMTLVLRFHEAALLTRMGRFDEAMRKYTGFIPSRVTDEQVLAGLGLAHLRIAATPGEISAGTKDLCRAVGGALAALLTGDAAGAQTAYGEVTARFPGDANAHYAYGYYLLGSDPDRAIQEWQRTLNIDRTHASAHAMLAWAYWLLDQKKLALEHAGKALEKDPGITVARIVFGRLTMEEGRLGAGLENLERAAREDPANLEAHLALATAFSQAGRKLDSQHERELCMKLQSGAGAVEQP